MVTFQLCSGLVVAGGVAVMEENVRRKMENLLALRGKISIVYDWQQEEALELKAAEERETLAARMEDLPEGKESCLTDWENAKEIRESVK